MAAPQKPRNRTTIQPSNSTTRYMSISKGTEISMSTSTTLTIHNRQDMQSTQVSISGSTGKENAVHIHNKISVSH